MSLEELIMKMIIREKIKTIDNKIKLKKAQYNYRQTAIMPALLSGNFEFWLGKMFYQTCLQRLLHWKAQTIAAEKHYQGLNKLFKSDEKQEPIIKKYNKSNLICYSKHSFYKYYRVSEEFKNILTLKKK